MKDSVEDQEENRDPLIPPVMFEETVKDSEEDQEENRDPLITPVMFEETVKASEDDQEENWDPLITPVMFEETNKASEKTEDCDDSDGRDSEIHLEIFEEANDEEEDTERDDKLSPTMIAESDEAAEEVEGDDDSLFAPTVVKEAAKASNEDHVVGDFHPTVGIVDEKPTNFKDKAVEVDEDRIVDSLSLTVRVEENQSPSSPPSPSGTYTDSEETDKKRRPSSLTKQFRTFLSSRQLSKISTGEERESDITRIETEGNGSGMVKKKKGAKKTLEIIIW